MRRDQPPPTDLPEVRPQLATPSERAPSGPDWIHEIKYDGYRLIAEVRAGGVRLFTRQRHDWTDRFPAIAAALAETGLASGVLDGEVVVVRADGTSSFQDLQNVLGGGRGTLRYCLFDLLHVEGRDLRERPLIERKTELARLLGAAAEGWTLFYTDHVEGHGPEFHRQACGHGLEGIVSKRRDARHREGRTRDWLKVKCAKRQEFVVVGFTEPSSGRAGIGALLLATVARGELVFAGRVGSGFPDRLLATLRPMLDALELEDCPLGRHPAGLHGPSIHWVAPRLVAEVSYAGRTADGLLRHPSFKGFREDKPAGAVEREDPMPRPVAVPPARVRRSRRRDGEAEVAGIVITHPQKVLYADAGVTKLHVARYYEAIADRMLPFLAGRPLTLVRCPTGIGDCFYQKQVDVGIPGSVGRVPVGEGADVVNHAVVDSEAALITLVQLGVLEFHTSGARRGALERPDRFTIDLDPDPAVPWLRVAKAALELRNLLADLGLVSFLKTTGGKGLHVVVPVQPTRSWEEVKVFSQGVAAAVAAAAPGRYTLTLSKTRRTGRILLDYLRNGRGATAIEAYSTRARPGATVALPVQWETLADRAMGPGAFRIDNVESHLRDVGQDPWGGYADVRQSITDGMMAALNRAP